MVASDSESVFLSWNTAGTWVGEGVSEASRVVMRAKTVLEVGLGGVVGMVSLGGGRRFVVMGVGVGGGDVFGVGVGVGGIGKRGLGVDVWENVSECVCASLHQGL